jgi:hypothetical protein
MDEGNVPIGGGNKLLSKDGSYEGKDKSKGLHWEQTTLRSGCHCVLNVLLGNVGSINPLLSHLSILFPLFYSSRHRQKEDAAKKGCTSREETSPWSP